MNVIGYFHGIDPAAALVRDGQVVAFVEEERLIRFKHASGVFPIRSIDECLRIGALELHEIDYFAYGWDAALYSNGGMKAFFAEINGRWPPDSNTRAWQKQGLSWFSEVRLRRQLRSELMRFFGVPRERIPPLRFFPHHRSHASAAFFYAPVDEALVVCIDGSGDRECTTVWHGNGIQLDLLESVRIPHSLGWFYAAITEYLGFSAYDGEYKVMGLAAYGSDNFDLRGKLDRVARSGPRGWDYEVDPRYIHHGPHSYSNRFTDHLVELLGFEPRLGEAPIGRLHEDLAFEAQRALESHVLRLLEHWQVTTGLRDLCIGGGVGLNVKMNSRIHQRGLFDTVHAFPVPNDSATGLGAAVGLYVEETQRHPSPISHVYWGPSFSNRQIEDEIRSCGLAYVRSGDIATRVADLLATGKIVGWFQGSLEAGPRALGGRSILADPRSTASRDRVNAAIKFREYWRPFCPSITSEAAHRLLEKPCHAPFMILAFKATPEAREKAPGVVHVDGTMRAQIVDRASNSLFYQLLEAFEARTGVPALLNTSFNVKGEAIVSSPRDALRTFFSTGIDALAMGPFLIEKPAAPVPIAIGEESR